MNLLIPGYTLHPISDKSILREPHRVLKILKYPDPDSSTVLLIPIEPRHKGDRYYFLGYKRFDLSAIEADLAASPPLLRIIKRVGARRISRFTDEELNKKFARKGQNEAVPLTKKKARWALIQPLLENQDADLLFDREYLAHAVKERAKALAPQSEDQIRRLRLTIHRCLNQYWAGGSLPGALVPFQSRCGAKGTRHKMKDKKIGPKNARTRAKVKGVEGLICVDEHIAIIQYCYRNFVARGTSVRKACRKMWRDFYSTLSTDDAGKAHPILLPEHQRPTYHQFRSWGEKQNPDQEAWKKQLPRNSHERNFRALPGSATNDVYAVGQRAAVDSTPPDLQIVSLLSRLRRIGGGCRILVRDTLFGYIPGLYMGLHAPCSETVKLAFFNAMMDKTQWLADLGLDCSPDDWIPMTFTQALADNTDLRTKEVKEALQPIGTNLMYVPVSRSDMNPVAEAGHHILHRMADHNLLGTTYGRRTERGEEQADIRARHTIIEAIRETVRAVHVHNTMELRQSCLTLEMRRAGVRPTRLDMTRWAIQQGHVARSLIDLDFARTQLLPIFRGTFTESGVRLLRPDTGEKRVFIEGLRYVSRHPLILAKMEQARRGGKQQVHFFDADFRVEPYNPRQVHYLAPDEEGLLALDLTTRDPDLASEATLYDVVDMTEHDAPANQVSSDRREQALSEMESEQDRTKHNADAAYRHEADALSKPLSKSAQRANKRENRDKEEDSLLDGMPNLVPRDATNASTASKPSSISASESPVASTQAAPETGGQDSSTKTYGSLLKRALANRRSQPVEA